VACFLVAVCVGVAAVASALRGDAPLVAFVAAAALGAAGTEPAVRLGRARQRRGFLAVAQVLARRVREEPPAEVAAPVRVVAFKRKGCSACALYDAVVRPGLSAEFGESIDFDERDLGDARTEAPVIVILGARDALFVGLPEGEPYAPVHEAVLVALGSSPKKAIEAAS
jgi:hypothetical protein